MAVLVGVPGHIDAHSPELVAAAKTLSRTLDAMEPYLWRAALSSARERELRLDVGLQLLRRATKKSNGCTSHGKVTHTLGRLLVDMGPHVIASAVRVLALHEQHGCVALCHADAASEERWRASNCHPSAIRGGPTGASKPPIALMVRGRAMGEVRLWADASHPFSSGASHDTDDFPLSDLIQMAADAVERVLLQQEAALSATMRENFLSVASRELRTPLTALNLQLENLARLLKRPNDPGVLDRVHAKMGRAFR